MVQCRIGNGVINREVRRDEVGVDAEGIGMPGDENCKCSDNSATYHPHYEKRQTRQQDYQHHPQQRSNFAIDEDSNNRIIMMMSPTNGRTDVLEWQCHKEMILSI
mmetsp:Transcript_35406/g.47529  ORF Transcript_35406/g.47529 Transcript_35406/m.47529 type:complete len:105 (+) Transcript_35406:451-765(+)